MGHKREGDKFSREDEFAVRKVMRSKWFNVQVRLRKEVWLQGKCFPYTQKQSLGLEADMKPPKKRTKVVPLARM